MLELGKNNDHSADVIAACAEPYLPAQKRLQLSPTCHNDWKYDGNGGWLLVRHWIDHELMFLSTFFSSRTLIVSGFVLQMDHSAVCYNLLSF